jgi:hypothetical protein
MDNNKIMSAAATNTAPAASAASPHPLEHRIKQFKEAKGELERIAATLTHEGVARENDLRPSSPSEWLAFLNLVDLSRREKIARETLLSLAPFAYRSGSFEKWHILLCRDDLLKEIYLYTAEIALTADGGVLRGVRIMIPEEIPLSREEATSLAEEIELIREMDEMD